MWHHISVCPWKIDVCTWAEVWPSSGGLRKIMCVHYSNTTKLLSKDVFSRYSTRCSGLMLILNNIEIRTPSLESRALYRIGKTHVHSIDPSPAKPWRIWRGCPYKNLCCNPLKWPLPVQTWNFQDQPSMMPYLVQAIGDFETRFYVTQSWGCCEIKNSTNFE